MELRRIRAFSILMLALLLTSKTQSQVADTTEVLKKVDSLYSGSRTLFYNGIFFEGITLLDSALALMDRHFEKDHIVRAYLMHSKAWGLMNADRVKDQYIAYSNNETPLLKQAKTLLEDAIQIKKLRLGWRHESTGLSVNQLGLTYDALGLFQEAINYYFEAASIFNSIPLPDSLYYSWTLNNVALSYVGLGEYSMAAMTLERSIAIKENIDRVDEIELSNNYGILSSIYSAQGDYFQAEASRLKIISTLLNAPVDTVDLHYYWRMNNVGLTYLHNGESEKAIYYLEIAKSGKKRLLGAEHKDVAMTVQILGLCYTHLEENSLALEQYQEALKIYRLDSTRNALQVAWTLNNIGNCKMGLGQVSAGLKDLETALAIKEELLGKYNPDWYSTYESILEGQILNSQYETTEAELLDILEHQAAEPERFRKEYRESLIRTYQLYYAWNKPELALNYIDSLVSMDKAEIDQVLGLNTPSLLFKYLDLASLTSDYYFSLQHIMPKPSKAYCRNAYNIALRYKSLQAEAETRFRDQFIENGRTSPLRDTIIAKQDELYSYLSQPIIDAKEIHRLEEEIKALEYRLARSYPPALSFNQRTNYNDIKELLNQNEVALEYIYYQLYNPFKTDSIYYAALLLHPDHSEPVFIPLFSEGELYSNFMDCSHTPGSDEGHIMPSLYNCDSCLYRLAWQPIEPYLRGKTNVYYAPAGLLHLVNLNAICHPQGEMLSAQYNFIRLNTTRELTDTIHTEFFGSDCVLFGGLAYEVDSTAINTHSGRDPLQAMLNEKSTFAFTDIGSRGNQWEYLPGSKTEVSALQEIMKFNAIPTTSYSGPYGSEENFKTLSCSGSKTTSPRIIHIATHGYFFPDKKRRQSMEEGYSDDAVFMISDYSLIRSGLILAGGNYAWTHGHPYKPGMEDGILTAYEISQMDLGNTELVVLSACETGLGDIKGNEGVYGLQRAFKIAGVKNLIMSLWKVPDAATAELMISFYKHWLEDKMTIRQALYTAQKELRDDGFEPYYWAGWVLVE